MQRKYNHTKLRFARCSGN